MLRWELATERIQETLASLIGTPICRDIVLTGAIIKIIADCLLCLFCSSVEVIKT
jgi:hypothetical protein